MLDIAYARLELKSFTDERRIITGIASTPMVDRQNHTLDPAGVTFTNPLPLLLHHDRERPVGTVTLTAPGADGVIAFTATLPTIAEPGALRDRVDEAWQSIKAQLLRGVSIGFRVLDGGLERLKGGVVRLVKTEICELSLVTIPANTDATILTIKALDAPFLAALGPNPAPARTKGAHAMTTIEHIAALEASRAATVAAMQALMQGAADAGLSLADQGKADEYDELETKTTKIDADLARYRALERFQVSTATPITPATPRKAAELRAGVVSLRPNVPPGTAFIRSCMAMFRARGDSMRALEYAKQWKDSTPEVELMIKAAVAPGSTTDPAWAGVLVTVQNATEEFIALLRPATILGKIVGLRQVPFNTQVPVQTGGGTYGWVGQAKLKPVTSLALGTAALSFAKAAGIIVITDELAKLSTPSAETIVRNDMIAGIAQFLDQQFIDPAVVAVADVNPASITNGAATALSTDTLAGDLGLILAHFAAANLGIGGLTLIMSEKNAAMAGMLKDAGGGRAFPGLNASGGTAEGFQVITSNTAGTNVIALQPNGILYADDGGVAIDVSREASVLMDSAPPAAPDATAVYTSLWQANLVGLRAERMVNWKRAIDASVYYLTDAVYPATVNPTVASAPTVQSKKSA